MSGLFKRLAWVFALATAALGPLPALAQFASPPIPSAKLISAPLMSPSSLSTYYGGLTTHSTGAAAFTSTPPEIIALARTLGADRIGTASNQITQAAFAQNVYTYLRNNIETEFRFGLAKGGRGALIDQSGTPFDVAQLMVELLAQGGITASYQVGTVTLSAQDFGTWSGFVIGPTLTGVPQTFTTINVNAQAACQFLADGGIPATVNGASSCSSLLPTSSLTTVTMAHVWVSALGNLYDPSYKHHIFKAGIDYAAAMGCGPITAPTCGSTITTQAMTGAASSYFGSASVQSITSANETQVKNYMTTYATNLEHVIQALNPALQLDDIVGGKEIDLSWAFTVSGTGSPYSSGSPFSAPQYTWTGDVIPDQFRTKLQVSYLSFFSTTPLAQTFFADEISTRRLRVFYDATTVSGGSSNWEFWADDNLVANLATAAGPGSGDNGGDLTLSVIHPYAANSGTYANDSLVMVAVPPFTIIQSWGESSASTQTYLAQLQTADPSPYKGAVGSTQTCKDPLGSPTSYADSETGDICRADDQPATVASYLAQRSLANALIGQIQASPVVTHHVLGVVSATAVSEDALLSVTMPDWATSTVDVRAAISTDSERGLAATSTATFEVASAVSATLEGVVTQQAQGLTEPISGAARLVLANRAGTPLLYIPPSAMSATLSSISSTSPCGGSGGYNSTRMSMLTTAATNGFTFILPEVGCVSGYGVGGDLGFMSGQLSYLYAEAWKGGAAPMDPDPAGAVLKTAKQLDIGVRKKSFASVNLATGSLTFKPPPDLVTGAGDFPFSLPFQRSYQSDAGAQETMQTTDSGGMVVSMNWTNNGPDRDDVAFLGGGWTHNYDISARIGSDTERGLGRVSGVDASAAIASIETLGNLLTPTPSFSQRVASLLTSYWMGRQLFDNTVTISRLPSQSVFTLMPDGTFNPPPGSSEQLVQSGFHATTAYCVADSPFSPCAFMYDYSPVSFTLTGRDGSLLSFNSGSQTQHYLEEGASVFADPVATMLGDRVFKPTQWTFPSGVQLTFNYTAYGSGSPASSYPGEWYQYVQRYYLSSVSNNLGRSLTLTSSDILPSSGPGAPISPGRVITLVTDENGRSVGFANSGCATAYDNNGGGTSSGHSFAVACPTFTVTDPLGNITKYTYQAGSDSPDPAWITKPTYHLRRWFTPDNATTPYETFAYDSVYRAATATDILSHATTYYAGGFGDDWLKIGSSIDALGNVSTGYWDRWNSELKSVDALGGAQYEAFDSAHRVVLATNRMIGSSPPFSCTSTTYDFRSNALISGELPAGSCSATGFVVNLGSGTPITTYTSYGFGSDASNYLTPSTVIACSNPVTCNKPATTTDALGNVTTYSWNSTTGLLTQVLKPADVTGAHPETDLTYSLYGPTGSQFSLLSQKTEKMTATQNVVTSYTYNTSNKYVLQTAVVDPGTGHLNLQTCFKFDAVGNLISSTDARNATCP